MLASQKNAIKRYQVMNEVCYEKYSTRLARTRHSLVFVHSRKETEKTAEFIRDTAMEKQMIA